MLLWKRSKEDLLHVIAHLAHSLSCHVGLYKRIYGFIRHECSRVPDWEVAHASKIVRDERDKLEAEMILNFNNEFSKYFLLYSFYFIMLFYNKFCFSESFQHHICEYLKNHIWISAAKPDMVAHHWHMYYSTHSKVLKKLATQACSKTLGIGSVKHTQQKKVVI